MKINQLFRRHVDIDVVMLLVQCFGLANLDDRRMFSKQDLAHCDTVNKVKAMIPTMEEFYLPCKARVYLSPDMCENRAVTILRQVVRLHGYHLESREKNINNRKVIFYQLRNDREAAHTRNMHKVQLLCIMSFS